MDPVTQTYSEWLLWQENERLKYYEKCQRYYDGDHPLKVPEKYAEIVASVYNIKANYCDAIVNAPVSRLKIEGIGCEDKTVLEALTATWKKNRMDAKSTKLNRNAIKKGDCFAQVWPHFPAGGKKPDRYEIKYLAPETCLPIYATDDPESLLSVRKQWISFDGNGNPIAHKWLFYPDRIERYYSLFAPVAPTLIRGAYDLTSWTPDNTDGFDAIIKNDYGMIPIVHFRNMEDESPFGTSELQNAFTIQDGINKLIIDLLRTADFQAFKQRYLLGVDEDELPKNKETGKPELLCNPGDIWRFPGESKEVTVGELSETDATSLLSSIASLIDHLSSVTRTPRTTLQDSEGTASSGFALAKVEAPLINKVKEKQTSFGNSYEDINKLLIVQMQFHGEPGIPKGDPVETEILWANLSSDSPQEKLYEAQRKQILKQNKVISAKRWQIEEGYTEEEITTMQAEITAEGEAAAADLLGHSFGNVDENGNPLTNNGGVKDGAEDTSKTV